mgnify:CR=1 FL=1
MVTIATVAGRTGISAYNLRFYEKEGLISDAERRNGEVVSLVIRGITRSEWLALQQTENS